MTGKYVYFILLLFRADLYIYQIEFCMYALNPDVALSNSLFFLFFKYPIQVSIISLNFQPILT